MAVQSNKGYVHDKWSYGFLESLGFELVEDGNSFRIDTRTGVLRVMTANGLWLFRGEELSVQPETRGEVLELCQNLGAKVCPGSPRLERVRVLVTRTAVFDVEVHAGESLEESAAWHLRMINGSKRDQVWIFAESVTETDDPVSVLEE